jgi:hypothetical protein
MNTAITNTVITIFITNKYINKQFNDYEKDITHVAHAIAEH